MSYGLSHEDAEKRSYELLDEFLAKRYSSEGLPKKKHEKKSISEEFAEMIEKKRHWLDSSKEKGKSTKA